VHGDQGKGETIVIGAGSDPTIQINFLPLLFGGNLRGSIFGGLKTKTDFPIVVEKCKNKVNFNYTNKFVHSLLKKGCGYFMLYLYIYIQRR
jgi:S-(hydroxymethyl)glutathione dehydrogenase/alcohol dehydrogenase